jgi:hypothetical protein
MFNDKNFMPTSSIQDLQSGKEPRKVPSGEYEINLLCADCDGRIIGGYENYAQKASFGDVSKINPNAKEAIGVDGSKALQFKGLDYKNYKLFLLSILWRMSISQRPMFSEVDLGDHNEVLRQMIYTGNPKQFYQYPVLTSHYFNDATIPTNLIITPVQVNREDFPRVLVILPGYLYIFIISDNPPNLNFDELAQLVITEDGSMVAAELATGAAMQMIMALRYIG